MNATAATAGVVAAHLLGGFRLSVDGNPVDVALRRRVRDVLAYLVTHRRAAVPRDVLMDVIWPGSTPGQARNSLHVALSGARQSLRAASATPVIERRHDSYRIAPVFEVWTDVEQFERECSAGRRAEVAGDPAALRHYERACQLYEGDFLADDPYSGWTLGRREELRLSAIELRSRLVDAYVRGGARAPGHRRRPVQRAPAPSAHGVLRRDGAAPPGPVPVPPARRRAVARVPGPPVGAYATVVRASAPAGRRAGAVGAAVRVNARTLTA
jgi:hypothetical protein